MSLSGRFAAQERPDPLLRRILSRSGAGSEQSTPRRAPRRQMEPEEEQGDDREDQPARLDAEDSAGQPRRAVLAAGEEAPGDRLAALVPRVRCAEDVERDVVEEGVER